MFIIVFNCNNSNKIENIKHKYCKTNLFIPHNMDTQEIQQKFLNYFRKHKHRFMKPSKVFNDDPSLFFVNSGMCQLKDIFLGKKEFDTNYTKIMNYQQCIRVGGKHNDLEEVGLDSYHLTCFTMLGNWSLGSTNKKESIELAFKFLVEECKLDVNNIYVTYFEGYEELECDTETRDIWQNYLPNDKIIPSKYKDNFWTMGNEGPCGPCTEIHYDLVGNRDAKNFVNKSDPNVIEIWNLVFIQYNLLENQYIKLEKQFLDTGLGLERLSMILQKKNSVYHTDNFKYLFGYAQSLTNSDFYTDLCNNKKDIAYRIFVDHIRTVVILLYHGVDFDCNNRGFILRKIYRRLLTNTYLYLNDYTIEQLFTNSLVSSLITDLLNFWLEFTHDKKTIHEKLIEEEKLYLNQIKGIKIKYNKSMKIHHDLNIVKKKLKESSGIDSELIDNLHLLNIKY